ncbi:MAG TPA: translation initiation factor IF-3 [Gammaproteobacteria bacterium]|nr:translation initiation factor IF-3 [Gammaproteobacteria bacterium]HKH21633.1 translation initiation factor IF-3 [Gammaproteobacteria bacterium]
MSASKDHRLNQEIDNPRIRLIDKDGTNVGLVPIDEAQWMAEQAELDLVEIVPSADPPVCRIMNYGKFKFEQSKKAQQSRKKQKQIQVKEVKFRPGTEEGDYRVKVRNLTRFLNEGDKAKVTIRFRGREMMHQDRGAQLLGRIETDLEGIGTVEQRPKLEGRQMVMVLSPKKSS